MKFSVAPDTKEGILTLSGELTLLQAEQLKMLLAQAVDASECVRINTEAVTDIDLSCLQLICSAHRSAVNRHRQLVLTPHQSEAFMTKVFQTGLMCCHDCDFDIESDCLWKGGDR